MAQLGQENLWQKVAERLRTELGDEYGDWFGEVRCLRCNEAGITLGFPTSFHRERIRKTYQGRILTVLREIAGGDTALEFEVFDKGNEEPRAETQAPVEKSPVSEPERTEISTPAPTEKPKRGKHPQLNEEFSFERYVIGENNNYAANVALAISRNPGSSNYNPFFIYGGVGLGKTHLMQAIGNSIHQNTNKKVIYTTSENFLNEFMESIPTGNSRNNDMNIFRNKFRKVDVLLIDDIQFLAKKPGVQEELFHTFNALMGAKQQVVFTSDRPPSELKDFQDRLVSRFNQGVKVDLQPPRYEVRFAILKTAAENRGVFLSNEVYDYVSRKVATNVRDLLSALTNLISYTEVVGKEITLEIAQKKLMDLLASNKEANLSIEIIQRVVADYFSIGVNDLKGSLRSKNIVYPRQLAMYLCREMTQFSSTEIGRSFGGRDHSTVIHSLDKVKGMLITDPSLDTTLEILKKNIKEYNAKV
ncbi:MAG: chromosomal replication initiator protein DnaA [Treponema sp.]|nr:chromosomal replication initiator protein DnaA [Treponema sp.]